MINKINIYSAPSLSYTPHNSDTRHNSQLDIAAHNNAISLYPVFLMHQFSKPTLLSLKKKESHIKVKHCFSKPTLLSKGISKNNIAGFGAHYYNPLCH